MTKKLIKLFVTAAVIFTTFTNTAKNISADLGDPGFDPYNAWVTNKNGVDVYYFRSEEDKVHLPYGSRIYVWNGPEGEAYDGKSSYIASTDTDRTIVIDAADFYPLSKTPDRNLSDDAFEFIAINNVSIYDGPSTDYTKIMDVEKGAILTSDYNDGKWAHVTYNGTTGWAYFRMTSDQDEFPSLMINVETVGEKITVKEGMELYSRPDILKDTLATTTEDIECNYYYVDYDFYRFASVIYDGQEVWIKTSKENVFVDEDTDNDNETVNVDQIKEELNIEEKIKQVPNPIWYVAGSAVVASLSGLVIIKLLNMKK